MSTTKVHSYDQTVYDVVKDSQRKQRAIGSLVDNGTTLTVKSTLSKSNQVDYYKMSVTDSLSDVGVVVKAQGAATRKTSSSSVYTSVSTTNDVGYVNVQVLDKRGQVIADSSNNASLTERKNYQSLRDSKLSLDKGSYTVKVSYADGVLPSKHSSEYAVQFLAGSNATKSYTTTEYSATAADSSSTISAGSVALSIIDASASTSSYSSPATGTIFDYTS